MQTPTPSPCDILVVDDDRDFADSLAQLLRLEGYAVRVAYSAGEALRSVVRQPASVALVDLILGHDRGSRLIRDLRDTCPGIVTVIMTAYASVETAIEALQEGAYDYLCKPFYSEDLLATLQRCFERRRLTRERETAEAAVRQRNRELEALNARLARMLTSLRMLSRGTRVGEVCARLLETLIDDLGARGGAVYLRGGGGLERQAALGTGFLDSLPLPPAPLAGLGEALDGKRPTTIRGVARLAGLLPDALIGEDTSLLAFPMVGGAEALLGLVLVHRADAAGFTRQDSELGRILVSFATEVMLVARAGEELAASEARLREIIDNSPSAISLKNLQGEYLLTNGRFDEWFGLGQGARPGAAAEAIGDALVAETGAPISRELEVSLVDGTARWLFVTRFPVVDGEGAPIGVGTIATDMTERRRALERLGQAQRIEAMGQLTGGVAHDFNNLLAVIHGNLRLLQTAVRDDPGQRELVDEALEASRSGAELTRRLLAFGRDQTLHPEATDVGALVGEMSRLLARTLGEGVRIRLDIAEPLWRASVDRSQLRASLLNLAINARDAMPEGGELLIRAGNLRVDPETPSLGVDLEAGRYVLLSVMDTGVGMAPEVLRNAIQPFFTTKEAGQGSGLGLSMVYGFVTQSGGHFELVSERGVGTTANLYFPVGRSDPARAPARADPLGGADRSGRGERVLVVEDQADVRRLARRFLSRLGYQVLEAGDGDTALAMLRDDVPVDVLFTDVVLPGKLSGFALGRAALAENPDLRVIYTTGYAADSLQEAAGLGCPVPVLRKPVQIEDLARALRSALEQR